MKKIEQVLRELSELYNFNLKIEELKKANAHKLGQGVARPEEPGSPHTTDLPKPQQSPDIGLKP